MGAGAANAARAAAAASEGADGAVALAGGYSSEASRAAAEEAKMVFSLAGGNALSMTRRRTVYAAMLASMGAEGKLRVTARIGREVLAAALEGSVHIDSALGGTATPSSQLLLDAFDVLCCEDIKVKVGVSSAGAEFDAEAASQLAEDDAAAAAAGGKPMQAAIASARTRLLSRMNRKAVLEHVVPVLIALKQKLEASNSPLVGSLMRYLKQLFLEKETRAQVLDVLADSRTLANEILYDLRMFDERQEAAVEEDEAADPPSGVAEGPSSRLSGPRSRAGSAMAPPMSTSAARLTTTPAPTPLIGGTGTGSTGRSRSRSSVGSSSGRTPAQRRGRSRHVGAAGTHSPMVPLSLDKGARENASSGNAARDAALPMSASPKLRAPRRTRSTRAAP